MTTATSKPAFQTKSNVEPLFNKRAENNVAKTPVFTVTPVFGQQGVPCDPAHEMLAVAMVIGGKAVPVDCVPLRHIKAPDLPQAQETVRRAYAEARAEMTVTFRDDLDSYMPGWHITSDRVTDTGETETLKLEFVREGLGEKRLTDVLRDRTCEHAHQKLGLSITDEHRAYYAPRQHCW